MKKLLSLLVILLALSVSADNLFAQSTGKIAGKIIDQKTNETLIGATVVVQGTTKGAAANVEGRYVLGGLAPGKYTVEVKYVGYQAKSISDVIVKADAVTNLDVTLTESASNALGEVVIKATYRQESVASLYSRQKNSVQVTDGISADIIRRSPDRNTGDVLKRVSGTSVQDGKFVVIRGLAERYNVNLLNGSLLPSSEPDRKAFSFDIIPASLIDNIVVYKTATPDLPGDFAGGAINTITRDIPDTKFMEGTVSFGYNSKSTFKDNFVDPQPNGKYDFLGFDDGSRKLPSAYTNVKSNYTSGTSSLQKIEIAKQFPNTFGSQLQNTLPNLGLQFATGNSKTLKNENRLGYNFAFNYNTGYRISDGDRTQYNISAREQLPPYSFDRNVFSNVKTLGGLLTLGYTYGKNKLAMRTLFNNDFKIDYEETKNGLIRGDNDATPTLYRGFSSESTQNGVFNTLLEGQHTLGENKLNIDWAASYGLSYRNQPDQRIVTVFTPENAPEYISFSSENSPLPNTLGRVYSKLNENIYQAKVNATYSFKWLDELQRLKIGGLGYRRDRDFTIDALGYVDIVGNGKSIPLTNGVTVDNIFSPESIGQNNIAFSRLDLSSTDYTGTANQGAGYAMLDNKLTEKLRLVWGARIEYYNQQLDARGKAVRKYVNTDLLPSANLTYSLSDKSNLRASFSKTLNRPEFRELADFRYFDYQTNFNITGNPNLKRAVITNADLRFEYFPTGGEIISVSAFYKKFKDPIEQINLDNDILSYANAESAKDFGAEVELRKKLNFISDANFFRDITFYLNASYINAKVKFADREVSTPLQGQSPYLINSGLYYSPESSSFTFNVLYNRIGERLRFRGVTGSIDIYEKPRDVIDFQISKRILNKRAELKLTLSDLLAQTNALYYNYGDQSKTAYNPSEDRIIQNRYYGFSSTLSFKYNFK
ncbi:TonB-dependent receptor [Mucilaginibacter sp. UR6-1]|uniref:TonB-dependent receptor n=1 Tax=Mucilaginibacter sp. UR6-1 TaxID=1435643 RepID=UPI001E2C7818|nr:TonB-dependent receptor [Mucilaginibacter sp. UR6-1]